MKNRTYVHPIVREDDGRRAYAVRMRTWIDNFMEHDMNGAEEVGPGEYALLKMAAELHLALEAMPRKARLKGKGREMSRELAGLIMNLRRGRGKR
jgi:hypothetical protein